MPLARSDRPTDARDVTSALSESMREAKQHRPYGSDAYWIGRHQQRARTAGDDLTDEWLLTWTQLQPLLAPLLPRSAAVLDLGCGTSFLCMDLLRDFDESATALAIDIAIGAIEHQREEQLARVASNEASAARAAFARIDATKPGAALSDVPLDACVDKSTTDGLLCDVHRGAERVRQMYANVGRAIAPRGIVVVCSWRDPESDGLEWIVDLVLGGLQLGVAQAESPSTWSLDVHTLVSRSGERGPHVYLLQRRLLRRSSRRPASATEDEQGLMRMRHHLHQD